MRDSNRSSSFFNNNRMIDKNVVKSVVEEWLKDKEYFLVDESLYNARPDLMSISSWM